MLYGLIIVGVLLLIFGVVVGLEWIETKWGEDLVHLLYLILFLLFLLSIPPLITYNKCGSVWSCEGGDR